MKLPASPWDYLTSTDKHGKVRFDGRKTFEVGSFIASTVWCSVLIYQNKFTFEMFVAYLATWAAARWLRDREQRLNKAA